MTGQWPSGKAPAVWYEAVAAEGVAKPSRLSMATIGVEAPFGEADDDVDEAHDVGDAPDRSCVVVIVGVAIVAAVAAVVIGQQPSAAG